MRKNADWVAGGVAITVIGAVLAYGAASEPSATHTGTAKTAPSGSATPITHPGYSRDQFGPAWPDLDHDGCHTRDEILDRDMTKVKKVDGCDVKSGTLKDPYTGTTILFTDKEYWKVQIDHIYPLHLAWVNGADQWTRDKRILFANDRRNLLAVQGTANSSKGDSGPGEWVPKNKAYACTYAHKYVFIARRYRLGLSADDKASITALETTCPKAKG